MGPGSRKGETEKVRERYYQHHNRKAERDHMSEIDSRPPLPWQPGKTSLTSSSWANLRSFMFKSFPRAADEVSVVSLAMTMTGVGAALLGCLGLNRS